MAIEFKLPELGENIETADIVKVLVAAGDKINVDQIILEIETDKATVEVPSEYVGVIKEINVKEGDTAKVGQVIMVIEENSAVSEEEGTEDKVPESNKDQANKVETSNLSRVDKFEIRLPELGENIEIADVIKVLISVGDKIEVDQILLEIETDKATVELPSEVSGIVKEILTKDGDQAKVGDVLFVVETKEITDEIKEKGVEVDKETKVPIPELKEFKTVKETKSVSKIPDVDQNKIVPAAPSVRRFAREIGIDIHLVRGSGPGGRISVEDVKLFAKNLNDKITKSGVTFGGVGIKVETLPDFSKWGEVSHQAMTNVRKKTTEHLSYAWATVPHVTQFDKADITDLEKLRKQFAPKAEAVGGKLTITAILLKIMASGLKGFPQFNSSPIEVC
jgi:pyruvate dehydrogenase E2 component (dihydrolipoamide acetyltransferase)